MPILVAGTFGQEKPWQLGMSSTYQHPLAPKDVLFDPLTLPAKMPTDSTQDAPPHKDSTEQKKKKKNFTRLVSFSAKEVDREVGHFSLTALIR